MGNPNWENRTIWTGDNRRIMRGMNANSVDLIYFDPPFNAKKKFRNPLGLGARDIADLHLDAYDLGDVDPFQEADDFFFSDIWTLKDEDVEWIHGIQRDHPKLAMAINAGYVHSKGQVAYNKIIAESMLEMHRLLKPTGSIYCHCDPTANYFIRLMFDALFGKDNFRNEIIWRYGKMENADRNFPNNHDTIFRYTKTDDFTFNLIPHTKESGYRQRFKRYLKRNKIYYGTMKHSKDKLVHGRIRKREKELGRCLDDSDILWDFDTEFRKQDDVFEFAIIRGNATERTQQPTQKPIALMLPIILASSNEGDIVVDPFCGCASTCIAAEMSGRQFAGIDLSWKGYAWLRKRRINELDKDALFKGGKLPTLSHRLDTPHRTDLEPLPEPKVYKRMLFGDQEGRCNACGDRKNIGEFDIDHRVPKVAGGQNNYDNLQLLCVGCHRRKGTKTMAWLMNDLRQDGFIPQRQ